jgi:serine/threonine protein kinase
VTRTGTPGLIADRYETHGLIGRGGMAEVYAATDHRLGREVAVKMLLPAMAVRDDVRRRFEAEARAAARIEHPNAVAVFDTGEDDGEAFIVMERLPGETLADRLAHGRVDEEWVRRVAGDVLGALGAAHAAGIVHRDVKPGNVLLTSDDVAKLTDFGIAKRVDADPTTIGNVIGTPAYLAPERLAGAPASPRSDLYSLGVVLYEALAGAKPFPGDEAVAVARAVEAGMYAPLSHVRPDADAALVGVVERAMARDPDARFPSAAAMADALAVVPSPDATSILPVPPPVPPATRERPDASRRVGWLALAGAAVAAVVAAFALGALVRDAGDGPSVADPPAPTTPATAPTTLATAPPTTAAPPPTTVTSAPDEGDEDDGGGRGGGRGKGRNNGGD